MAFTAKDVQNLREMTGVGMLDCKKALEASDGNIDKAVEYLREKGLAAAQKKASRIAAEGIVHALVDNGVGAVVEVNAETDFVGQNETFQAFVKDVTDLVAKGNPADYDALMGMKYPGSEKTVQEMQQEKVLTIGENIKVRRFARYSEGTTVAYVHMGGRIGVLVNMQVSDGIQGNPKVEELGKDIAMQIAAMRPTYLDSTSIPADEIAKEEAIQLAKALEENKEKGLDAAKSEQIAQGKVKGRMNKFFEDICLVNQPYVKENKITVEQHVKNVAKELGGEISLKGFVRFEKGEGIEKKEDNFADEVASMIK